MVRDNDRRSQMQSRRMMDLQSANENSILLKEMLDELDPSKVAEDMLSTLREIYNNCVKHKPTVMRLAEESHESETFTNKIIDTSELLHNVIEQYTQIVVNRQPVAKKAQETPKISNLLDVASSESTQKDTAPTVRNYSDLSDIFTSSAKPAQVDAILLTPQVVPLASNADIMAMINNHKQPSNDDLFGNFDLSPQSPVKSVQKVVEKPKTSLIEIDSLVSGMKSKLLSGPLEKIVDVPVAPVSDSDDDVINLISEENTPKVVETKPPQIDHKLTLKDINLDINEIQPSDDEPPRVIMDEKKGLKILVNFTKDRPAKDVMVLVISVINQGNQAISNFQFDASVPKPCKLRILEANQDQLPAVKPFKPPTETINQVLLLMNPTQEAINMMAILTYNYEDDDDPCKESLTVQNIPFPRQI